MISIIVPTYNEEKTIEDFLLAIKKLKLKNYEVIIVDDSKDSTAEIAKKFMKKNKMRGKVIERVKKKGKGSAIRDGLKFAKGDYIALIDADLQYNPKDIPKMISLLKNYDLVNTRRLRKDSFYRKILGLIFRFFVFLLFGLKIETQSTLRAFKKELKNIKFYTDGWTWDVEFLYKAKKAGYRICEYPIIYGRRKEGKSKINVFTLFKMFFELLRIRTILHIF